VGGNDEGAFLGDVFTPVDGERKNIPRHKARQRVTHAISEIHAAAEDRDGKPRRLSSVSTMLTTCSRVRCELSMTTASGAIFKGAAAREESMRSRSAIVSISPCPARL